MLWFLRHAEAADGPPDETRPLTPHGIEQARIAGAAMAVLGLRLDTCLSSPKRRALETAQLACEPLRIEVIVEPALAASDYQPERLAAGRGETLLVGHNPAMSRVLGDLTGARAHLRKGGLACVEHRDLLLLIRPAELSAIAKGGTR